MSGHDQLGSDNNLVEPERRKPKSGQFQKGQSGNPRGRPRKTKAGTQPDQPEARYPTRLMIRTEAQRRIKVRDASGEQEIPVLQAVLRAMEVTALKGGVLAQRSLLEYFLNEDAERDWEKKEIYEFYDEYKKTLQPVIDASRAQGIEREDILPHPEDIELDELTLTVRCRGAQTPDDLPLQRKIQTIQALAYEMVLFTQEPERYEMKFGQAQNIGLYMMMYLWAYRILPRRLRKSDDQLWPTISLIAHRGKRKWEMDLRRRCLAAEFPFILGAIPLLDIEEFKESLGL